jgi:hypothetical protein
MSEGAKKTAVDTSPFEQVVAALMIVGRTELAEIMEAGRLGLTISATRATSAKTLHLSSAA